MTRRSASARSGADVARSCIDHMLGVAAALSLPGSREWLVALRGESWVAPDTAQRLQIAAGGLAGVALDSVLRLVTGCLVRPATLVLALALGLAVAVIDVLAGSRVPLVILLALSSFTFGALRPAGASLWGLLLGLGVPGIALLTDFQGPYQVDRGDVWFLVPPAVLLALVGRNIRLRLGAR